MTNLALRPKPQSSVMNLPCCEFVTDLVGMQTLDPVEPSPPRAQQRRCCKSSTLHADRKLRSAQAAFELLDSFAGSGVTARGAVAGAMLNKEADILAQFAHEVRWLTSADAHSDSHSAVNTVNIDLSRSHRHLSVYDIIANVCLASTDSGSDIAAAIPGAAVQNITENHAHVAQIDTTAAVYAQLSEDPPVTRSQPPVAGAIQWSRALFGRCKRTMKRAQALDATVLATDLGKAVRHAHVASSHLQRADDYVVPSTACWSLFIPFQDCIAWLVVPTRPRTGKQRLSWPALLTLSRRDQQTHILAAPQLRV